MFSQAVE